MLDQRLSDFRSRALEDSGIQYVKKLSALICTLN